VLVLGLLDEPGDSRYPNYLKLAPVSAAGAALFIVNWLESPMSNNALGGYMAFVLFIGAAMNDAFEWQRVAIRQQLGVHLEHMRSDDLKEAKTAMAACLSSVQQIMGRNWAPQGQWAQQIEVLLKGE
jgi:hypothetical protein